VHQCLRVPPTRPCGPPARTRVTSRSAVACGHPSAAATVREPVRRLVPDAALLMVTARAPTDRKLAIIARWWWLLPSSCGATRIFLY
jgi:hypothetical protein